MDSIPFAFVDALCSTLDTGNLGTLQEIGRPWSSTVAILVSRRRDLYLKLHVNDEGTGIQFRLSEGKYGPEVPYASLSKIKVLPILKPLTAKYNISLNGPARYQGILAEVLLSGLRGYARKIHMDHTGVECVEFIKKQTNCGRLEELALYGEGWPDSLLDLWHTNVTVDLDMATCFIEHFLQGDLYEKARLCGHPSFTPATLESIPWKSSPVVNDTRSTMVWHGPGTAQLRALVMHTAFNITRAGASQAGCSFLGVEFYCHDNLASDGPLKSRIEASFSPYSNLRPLIAASWFTCDSCLASSSQKPMMNMNLNMNVTMPTGLPSMNHIMSTMTPLTPVESPDEAKRRFEIECEFVQALCNPHYLNHLAQRGYFQEEYFVNYLKYLLYWKKPEYIKRLKYPQCLHFLEALQSAQFREAIASTSAAKFIEDQQILQWQYYVRKRARLYTYHTDAVSRAAAAAQIDSGDGGAVIASQEMADLEPMRM
uniref:Mediator of RNA polymerase II transcription subunit 31 n=1 Tax=Steinernema glaseri TaxID=37863 RepID=A0A1I7YSN2_9BILA